MNLRYKRIFLEREAVKQRQGSWPSTRRREPSSMHGSRFAVDRERTMKSMKRNPETRSTRSNHLPSRAPPIHRGPAPCQRNFVWPPLDEALHCNAASCGRYERQLGRGCEYRGIEDPRSETGDPRNESGEKGSIL